MQNLLAFSKGTLCLLSPCLCVLHFASAIFTFTLCVTDVSPESEKESSDHITGFALTLLGSERHPYEPPEPQSSSSGIFGLCLPDSSQTQACSISCMLWVIFVCAVFLNPPQHPGSSATRNYSSVFLYWALPTD